MNILVIAHYHYQDIGVPTALFVHKQIKAFIRAGHSVRVLVPTPMGKVGQDGKRFGVAVWANHYTSGLLAGFRRGGVNFYKTMPVRWDIMRQVTTVQLKTAVILFRVFGFRIGWKFFCILHSIHHGFKD